ncbi:peptidoglycan bridge formation glycyltransferase FemA/FemB family protein [Patescibacteria group bacterium]|nr:peptidoglycan bridge formation glycyltransferase FemA/FemB family protein [Patescibacteria group bacterium]
MITTKNTTNPKIWENFVSKHKEANFLQSYYHGITHQQVGKPVFFTSFHSSNKLIGVCLYIQENAKRARYLTVPGGPILNWKNKQLVQAWYKYSQQLAKKQSCSFIRIRPQILNNSSNRKIFQSLKLFPSPMHLTADTTSQLNLNKSLDQLLSQMRKSTRYEIKKATKLGIKVSTSINLKTVTSFYNLQLNTAKRQGFIPFSKSLFLSEFKAFRKNNQSFLYTAKHKNKILSQALIIHYPTETSYHFAASTLLNRQFPGTHALLWQAIQDAKHKKISRFNFWGVIDPNQTNHRFFGVSVFKRGFGGQDINYLPAHDLIINPLKYIPNYIFESLRKKLRHL